MNFVVDKLTTLSKNDLEQIFTIYNLCFEENRIKSKRESTMAKKLLGDMKIYTWYVVRNPDNRQIVSMASFVKDQDRARKIGKYDLNYNLGENLVSVSTLDNFRKRGLASKIIKFILQDVKKDLIIEIKKDKINLLHFYDKVGFTTFSQHSGNLFCRFQFSA